MSVSKQRDDVNGSENKPDFRYAPARAWQEAAVASWDGHSGPDFLIVATPGCGKTRVATVIARTLLARRLVERAVVVCPTEHLRRQWADAAHSLELSLDPKFSNGDGAEVAADYDGLVVTYQQVKFAPSLFRKQCEERKTFVVFDEIHHAGDDLAWGAALREAFGQAIERLALSGTPFRNDNCPIPFVTYHEGRSRADFTYTYAEALADGVCAPIYFPTLNGKARFLSRDGSYLDCWLLDDLPSVHAGERLRTILDPRGAWMTTALRAADEELTRVRSSGRPDAGALVVAIDQEHARQIARLLRRLTGTEPVLAISEDPGASRKIRRYGEGDDRFLVCVRMVSEGVDIPRLKVGVYATNITSELFLRQFAGRFVRGEGSAVVYIPAVEPITIYARQIKEERDHVLAQAIYRPDGMGCNGEVSATPFNTFTPLSSTSQAHDTIFDGQSFSVAELAYAKGLARELNVTLDAPVLAALLRRHASDAGVFVVHGEPIPADGRPQGELDMSTAADDDCVGEESTAVVVTPSPPVAFGETRVPLYERKEGVRKDIQRAASKLAGLIGVRPFVIHKQWIEMGGVPQGSATEEDLDRKLAYLLDRIREAQQRRPAIN